MVPEPKLMIAAPALQNNFGSTGSVSSALISKDPLSYCSDLEFLEVLTEGLERVLMVRGGGREVITIYS